MKSRDRNAKIYKTFNEVPSVYDTPKPELITTLNSKNILPEISLIPNYEALDNNSTSKTMIKWHEKRSISNPIKNKFRIEKNFRSSTPLNKRNLKTSEDFFLKPTTQIIQTN